MEFDSLENLVFEGCVEQLRELEKKKAEAFDSDLMSESFV